ncbi:metal cation symporter ZIP14-like [Haliotis rufescens]|uniref:metal cation symporter ZIP14-like n=1 Tax=Haliotis rufescens TaxID=6454 RepID=UPI00201EB1EC|nr:metal cation symporter ZIP14-like [Haliotis rufescens]
MMSLLLLLLVVPAASSTALVGGFSPLLNADTLISKYSSSSSLTRDEFHALFSSLKLHVKQNLDTDGILGSEDEALRDADWCNTVLNNTANTTCGQVECVRSEDVFNTYALDARINSSSLLHALPAIVIALEEDHCRALQLADSASEDEGPRKPTDAEAWGYGLGVVLTVCLISNLGAFLTPLMNSTFFQKLLMFLVAIAIGTQAGAGIVVLIPESMHLMYIEETKDTYLWKACSVLGGIIFVLLLERILKISFHQIKSAKERTMAEISVEVGSTVTMSTTSSSEDTDSNSSDLPVAVTTTVIGNGKSNGSTHDGKHDSSNGVKSRKTSDVEADSEKVTQQIAAVAWMVLLGDAIHKFVDGLSVGAAFTENITTGLSLAISVLCEELPHELGDVSILLHSGMTMKQALTYNTLSAAMGIPGLIVGIFVGETTSANQWIFAIAGGIFIYVPLADMIPEMGHAVDKALKEGTGAIFLSFLQLLGLMIGFGIIILVAAYAGEIQV